MSQMVPNNVLMFHFTIPGKQLKLRKNEKIIKFVEKQQLLDDLDLQLGILDRSLIPGKSPATDVVADDFPGIKRLQGYQSLPSWRRAHV